MSFVTHVKNVEWLGNNASVYYTDNKPKANLVIEWSQNVVTNVA